MSRHVRKFGAVGASTTLVGGASSALLLALAASPAGAATTFTVDTLADGAANASDCTTPVAGSCSLRDALNAAVEGDLVVFDPSLFTGGPGTISLDAGERSLFSGGASILGPGSDLLTIDAQGKRFPVLEQIVGSSDVNISGTTITGGNALAYGGGIFGYSAAGGDLILSDVHLVANSADTFGGGLKFTGAVRIIDSVLTGNSATEGAGAIYVEGDVYVRNTTFSGNTAGDCGGALYVGVSNGSVTVLNSTFANNSTTGCYGGAIDVDGSGNNVLIANSTFTGNSAPAGGALHFELYNQVQILATTITGNSSLYADPFYSGGGIHISAGGTGSAGSANVTLVGTILAGNTAAAGGAADFAAGGVGSTYTGTLKAYSSMVGEIGSNVTLTGSDTLRGSDPMLGALADNGGPTLTMLPLAGSPVIDAGPAPMPPFTGNEFDQRGTGYARIVGTKSDIGAVEGESAPEPVVPSFTG